MELKRDSSAEEIIWLRYKKHLKLKVDFSVRKYDVYLPRCSLEIIWERSKYSRKSDFFMRKRERHVMSYDILSRVTTRTFFVCVSCAYVCLPSSRLHTFRGALHGNRIYPRRFFRESAKKRASTNLGSVSEGIYCPTFLFRSLIEILMERSQSR